MSTQYTRDYFIQKFEAIPEEKWCLYELEDKNGCHCALGHCGVEKFPVFTSEAIALALLFDRQSAYCGAVEVTDINDGRSCGLGETRPKARILAALRDLPA